jgi:uncharacterized DUF497 family protein
MKYEWDVAKAAANLDAHGVSFESAAWFEWDGALVAFDEDHSENEDRYIALGFIGDVLHVMVHAVRGKTIRVISLRKATKQERKFHAAETR